MIIRIDGGNDITTRVKDVTYNLIGDTTAVTTVEATESETDTVTIYDVKIVLVNRFYTSHVFLLGSPESLDQVKPYGKQQADAVWNQYRNPLVRLSGYLKGLPADWPDLMHKYTFSDPSQNTLDRKFQLVSFEQNWKTGIWKCDLIEVYNSSVGKDYDDPSEFKYISDD
jgi:hypothetical protein